MSSYFHPYDSFIEDGVAFNWVCLARMPRMRERQAYTMERTYGALGRDSASDAYDSDAYDSDAYDSDAYDSDAYNIEVRVQADSLGYATSAPCGSPAVDAFDEAFDGDHDIEYWFWNGSSLIPASSDEAEHFRQREVQERAERFLVSAQRRRRTSRMSRPSQDVPWSRALSPLCACRDALRRVSGKRSAIDGREMAGRG